jgi:hypothetical protein
MFFGYFASFWKNIIITCGRMWLEKFQNNAILKVVKKCDALCDDLENIYVRDNIFELKSRKRLVSPSLSAILRSELVL